MLSPTQNIWVIPSKTKGTLEKGQKTIGDRGGDGAEEDCFLDVTWLLHPLPCLGKIISGYLPKLENKARFYHRGEMYYCLFLLL